MDILEAYKRTLEAAEELRTGGIEVKITPSKSDNDGTDEVLPRGKWVIIEFFPKNKEEAQTIMKKADELGWAGIMFDTSGGCSGSRRPQRQWEVDWSFDVGDTPDGEWEAARHEVEDMIEGTENPKDEGGKAL